MSKGVVDFLEVVQIQKQHRELPPVTPREHNRLGKPVVQQHSVWQIGEKVMLRQMGHFLSHATRRAHVVENHHGAGYSPQPVVDGCGGILDGYFYLVAPYENAIRSQPRG